MKSRVLAYVFICLLSGCGGGGDSGGGTAANVLTVSIGASARCTTVNELCTQVTICQPGTSSCQTIPDMLVDTGSFGVRIFDSVLSPSLTQVVDSQNNPIGECMFFADGSAIWGPVQRADVVLGGEPAVSVPIHVIAPTFAGQTASDNPCGSVVDSNPDDANFNGILGIGVFAQDCGLPCDKQSDNTLYFSCVVSTSICAGTTVPLLNQVQNPVWLLPSDNNGVILTVPNVPATGARTVSGSLILGIGTAANNIPPPGVSVFTTDPNGLLTTMYKGTPQESVIDSGSNGYFFPDPNIPLCPPPPPPPPPQPDLQDFYCPPALINLSATLVGANSQQATIPFQVANTKDLVDTHNAAFNNLGGKFPTFFIWGLPFFLGRTTYVGIEGQPSALGIEPLIAF